MIRAIAVVVPARDEERLLGGCLAAVRRAARHPGLHGVPVSLVVVADSCRDRTAAIARHAGAEVATTICDTSSEAAVAELAERTVERFGAVHALCNNAGILGVGDAWRDPMQLWERVIGVNLRGPFLIAKAVFPIMKRLAGGDMPWRPPSLKCQCFSNTSRGPTTTREDSSETFAMEVSCRLMVFGRFAGRV